MKHFWGILFICLLCTQPVLALGYSKADKFGKIAPYTVAETPESLAKYFMDNLEKPADRARALASWMVYQMDKDGYREKVIKQNAARGRKAPDALSNNPFQTRVGTPQEYAALYQQIGKLMGLDVEIIQGYAGKSVPYSADQNKSAGITALRGLERTLTGVALNNEMQPYQSAWNAVKIDGQWKLVDTYWMSRGGKKFGTNAQSDLAMENLLKNRQKKLPPLSRLTAGKKYDETFFFSDPRIFIRTHFPLDKQWQLLKTPVTWREFTR